MAAEAGLLAPHVGADYGGLGLNNVGRAVVFEEAGYSLLGPLAIHIFAPDEGNMHLWRLSRPRNRKTAGCGRWRGAKSARASA